MRCAGVPTGIRTPVWLLLVFIYVMGINVLRILVNGERLIKRCFE